MRARKIKKTLLTATILAFAVVGSVSNTEAHPGRTSSDGCHFCRTGCESRGYTSGTRHGHHGEVCNPSLGPVDPNYGGGGSSPSPENSPPETEIPTPTLTPTPTPTPTSAPTQTPTLTPKPMKRPTLTPTPRATGTPTITPTVTPKTKKVPSAIQQFREKAKIRKPRSPAVDKPAFYQVTRVIDGDTIRVLVDGKSESVRLLAIDTPEINDPRNLVQCFAEAASQKMTAFVAGKKVRLEGDKSQGDRDKYGRLLRYVYLEDGTFVNAEMVKQGYAFSYKKYPTQKLEEFNRYEREARERNLGLWGACKVEENGNTRSTNPTNKK